MGNDDSGIEAAAANRIGDELISRIFRKTSLQNFFCRSQCKMHFCRCVCITLRGACTALHYFQLILNDDWRCFRFPWLAGM